MRLVSPESNTIENELSAFFFILANPEGAIVAPIDLIVPVVVLELPTHAGIFRVIVCPR